MEVQPREIQLYATPEGKIPFEKWFNSLRDINARAKIRIRLDRVGQGNLGDYKSAGEGVFELRIDYGPGYRIYFGQVGLQIVIFLCGGDKSTQEQDISKAQEYWEDYKRQENV